jgi:hypothetical protein
VCRRWRGLVFGSPRRLNLQLHRTPRTSARKPLDIWPALPLLIQGRIEVDNVIALLEHSDHIRQFYLHHDGVGASQMKNLWTAMQVPFPELVALYLSYEDLSYYRLVVPDSFLGGSAPHLRFLALTSVPFPGLPKLLLSATHLVDLRLVNIPRSGYISPEAMATCLFMSTSLETLYLGFESPQSYPGPDLKSRRPFPPTRSVFPTLTFFFVQRGERILPGICGPDRCPSTLPVVDNVLH